MIVKLIKIILKRKLSEKNRAEILTALLDNIGALPIRNIISEDENRRILINGKLLNMEQAIQVRESAKAMIDNSARRIVLDSVRFLAVEQGIHQGISPEQILFAKAALWIELEEEKLYHKLAQKETEPLGIVD